MGFTLEQCSGLKTGGTGKPLGAQTLCPEAVFRLRAQTLEKLTQLEFTRGGTRDGSRAEEEVHESTAREPLWAFDRRLVPPAHTVRPVKLA